MRFVVARLEEDGREGLAEAHEVVVGGLPEIGAKASASSVRISASSSVVMERRGTARRLVDALSHRRHAWSVHNASTYSLTAAEDSTTCVNGGTRASTTATVCLDGSGVVAGTAMVMACAGGGNFPMRVS